MRILHINDNLDVGGVQMVVVNLSREQSLGHEIAVAAEPGGRLWKKIPDDCHRIFLPQKPRGMYSTMRYIAQFSREVRKFKPDIVHAHQRGVALIAKIACIGLPTKVIEHVHNTFLPVSQSRLSFRGAELIACGPEIGEMLKHAYRRPASRITTVTNAVPDPGMYEQKHLDGQTEAIHLMAVGRLSEQKNPAAFVRLIHALNQRLDSNLLKATWVGDGELHMECERLAKNLQVRNLEFVGDQENIGGWIEKSDLIVLTSRWEGLPLVLLEAIAVGRGVVAPDLGSCGETVPDGENGLIYDPSLTSDELADKLAPMLQHDILNVWNQRSRKVYESNFTMSKMTAEIEAVYLKAIGN